MAHLGKEFPNFEAETTHGKIDFHDWLGGSWAILFSHPADYTPVCTTELAKAIDYQDKFAERGVKMIALSCDSVDDHLGWTKDVEFYCSKNFSADESKTMKYPIIADKERKLAEKFGMLDPDEVNAAGIPLPARACFVIGPDKRLKLSILYPATTGRNFDEILRVIDSLQLTANKKVATPVNWTSGDNCMVLPNIKPEDAKGMFPGHKQVELPSGKSYLRTTPQP